MMTEAQLLVWGRGENETRKAELATVMSAADLERVKKSARRRRLDMKLSASRAAHAVKLAQMETR